MARSAYINLSTEHVTIKETDPEDIRRFLGGRGLGAKLLYELVGPEVDPLSPENCLIFTAGPFTGSTWPASSRLSVTFKSPLTGVYGYANSGGFFAAELRHAGYDTLVITGRAARPVILQIFDRDISFLDATPLWGATTGETFAALLGDHPESGETGRLACIGPAGENLVRIAAIMNDRYHAAGRGGPGAVMGSKYLKAILVQAANKPPMPSTFEQEARAATRKLQADPHLDELKRFGSLVSMDTKNATGDQPAKNHQLVQVPFIDKVNATAFDTYLMRHKGCYNCPITCARQSAIVEGPYAIDLQGPDYETANALGPMCWISDPEAIIYANHLCNEYGLDTISTGVTVAFAMELHEKGLLYDDELSLEWGDQDTLIGLIERMVDRQGLGNILAEGTRRAAQTIGNGAEYYAMQVKGMELPGQDPRFAKGFGLGHCTSNWGADHLYAMPTLDLAGNRDVAEKIFPAEIIPELLDPANEKYKPDLVVYGEHLCAVSDALGVCKFSTVENYSLLSRDLAPAIATLLGAEITEAELLRLGERIVNLERLYNARHGLARADDYLPARFTQEAAPLYDCQVNPRTGMPEMSPEPRRYGLIENLDAMLDRYYNLRGWSQEGKPTPQVLERLGLAEMARNGIGEVL